MRDVPSRPVGGLPPVRTYGAAGFEVNGAAFCLASFGLSSSEKRRVAFSGPRLTSRPWLCCLESNCNVNCVGVSRGVRSWDFYVVFLALDGDDTGFFAAE